MATLALEFNQENLQVITAAQHRRVKERLEQNYFLDLTRNASFCGEASGSFVKNEKRYLLIKHYTPKQEKDTGLDAVYKVDKDLWKRFEQKFPNEV